MEKEIVSFETSDQFEAWLAANYQRPAGVWLRLAKKGSGQASITYAQALDCALCFGWIDGQKAKYDESSWLQYFTRRKPRSIWSQINKGHIERLTREKRMREPGLVAVAEAKESGQWAAAYQPTRSREIPPELAKALNDHPKAKEFFETLNSQNRFAFVFRASSAKQEATRAKRIQKFIQMMENGEVFYPKAGPAPDS